jgi:hypothetical protein
MIRNTVHLPDANIIELIISTIIATFLFKYCPFFQQTLSSSPLHLPVVPGLPSLQLSVRQNFVCHILFGLCHIHLGHIVAMSFGRVPGLFLVMGGIVIPVSNYAFSSSRLRIRLLLHLAVFDKLYQKCQFRSYPCQ